MKQRDPIVATLFSIFVPFYTIYWLYDTAKQLQARGARTPSMALLFAPVIVLMMFIFVIISMTASGSSESTAGGILMLLILPAVALSLVYYYKFGAAVEQVTNGAITKGLIFILFWFVSPAAIFMIQEKLNQAPGVPASAGPMPPFAPSPSAGQPQYNAPAPATSPTPPQPPVTQPPAPPVSETPGTPSQTPPPPPPAA